MTTIPNYGPEADAAIKLAADQFPATFSLRAYRDDTFRISIGASYVSEGRVMLYTQRLVSVERYKSIYGSEPRDEGSLWLDFAKGTLAELFDQVVPVKSQATVAAEVAYDNDPACICEVTEADDTAELLADTITEADIQRAGACVETFSFTATMLRALAQHVARSFDDPVAAGILFNAAAAMARHESTVV
jgi:hypothetical protein